VPVPDAPERAVRMACAIRERVREMVGGWAARGHELSHGIGIAQGYATLGAIGFEGRWDYGAIGTVTNLAARLCAEAAPDQVLISQRVAASVARIAEMDPPKSLALRGFHRAVSACAVRGLMPSTDERVAGG
jgi:class 3 adenylate cyclase